MKAVLLLAVFVVLASAVPAYYPERVQFAEFKQKFSKTYESIEEYERRFEIFRSTLKKIDELNARKDGAIYGVTQFADLTTEEFEQSCFLMSNPPALETKAPVAPLINNTKLPASFNWADHTPPVVTPVYNQGQCGSCWAFSATENIESRWALAGHPLVELAVQQIVDCDTTDYGCYGGWPYDAYQYVMSCGGMDPLKDYPYVAEDEKCRFNSSEVVAKIKSWEYVTSNQDEEQMRAYLVAKGPLSVCVDASGWAHYTGGVFPASSCGVLIDHCVLATGYDMTGGYWIIRNSWGTSWGLNGYMKLQYGVDACSIGEVVTSSIV